MDTTLSMEEIFEKIYGNSKYITLNKKFLEEKIRYYSETKQYRPELITDIFVYEHYDEFELWCHKNNKVFSYPDLEFKVKN